MKTIVIYKPNAEHARSIEDYMRDFLRQTGRKLDTMDPESRDGSGFCQSYDIVEYPTIVAISDDGKIQNSWRGLPLPTISEVSYYA